MLTNDTTKMKMPAKSFDPTDPLTAAIRTLLFREWDPCSANGNIECEGDYDSYIPAIYRLAVDGKSINHIAARLAFVERHHMMLFPRKDLNKKVAARIFSLAEASRQQ